MGVCKICGKDAGFLRGEHRECVAKHQSGLAEIRTLIADKATTSITNDDVQKVDAIAKESFLSPEQAKEQVISGWEDAVNKVLEDKVLSVDEERVLVAARDALSLSQADVDRNGAFTKVVKAAVIRELAEGKIPKKVTIDGAIPFNLQKNEQIVWLFNKVKYYEERTRTVYQGGYSGVSVRVAKGFYYRTGGFRGNPVVTTNLSVVDAGTLAVTDKHVYFAGPRKAFRIPYVKIVAFRPYNNGIGIQRDAQSAKPQVFEVSDGWFIYNLITNLANLGKA